MGEALRALIIDDSDHDAKLAALALGHAGFDVNYARVETPEDLRAALAESSWDVVLTDHAMPRLDSLTVLSMVGALREKPPVVVLSGQIGEENLARAFTAGATDYVSKDRLDVLLAPAVNRALEAVRARRQIEEANWQLRRTEKLAALGTFVSGVAHEINNPLMYVVVNAELARKDIMKTTDLKAGGPNGGGERGTMDALDSILRGCQRIQAIVSGLQRIARSGEGPRRVVPLNDLVGSGLLEPPPNVELNTSLKATKAVLVNEQDLRDALHALLQNAYEASAGATHANVRLETVDTPTGVRIRVTDHGPGIPLEQQPHVFTPFYTTKPTGVGLSLSIAQRLVQDHGGTIEFESKPREGATFWIDLPAQPAPAAPKAPVGDVMVA